MEPIPCSASRLCVPSDAKAVDDSIVVRCPIRLERRSYIVTTEVFLGEPNVVEASKRKGMSRLEAGAEAYRLPGDAICSGSDLNLTECLAEERYRSQQIPLGHVAVQLVRAGSPQANLS
jgi:hypothetical protein